MAIIKTVNFDDFYESFHKVKRGTQFSYGALKGLYHYYNELSEEIGEPYELDVIDICCDWTEYTLAEYNSDFYTEHEDFDAIKEALDEKGIQYIDGTTETLVVSNT